MVVDPQRSLVGGKPSRQDFGPAGFSYNLASVTLYKEDKNCREGKIALQPFDLVIFGTASLANAGLGYFVYLRNKRSVINRTFLAMVLGIVAWFLANFLADGDIVRSLLWNRLTFAAGALLVLFIFYFTLIFSKVTENFLLLILIGLPAITISFLSAATDTIVTTVRQESWGSNPLTGNLYGFFPALLGVYLGASLITLFLRYRKSTGREKAAILYTFVGLLMGVLAGFFTNISSVWIYGDFRLAKYAPLSGLLFFGFTAYAILAHRLFDIRVIIKKTVIYSGLLAFVIGAYSLVIFTLASLFGTTTGISRATFLPNLIAALVVAAGFEPLRRWLVSATDKYLFVGEYRPEDVHAELAKTLASVIDLDEALRGMMQTLVSKMRLKRAATFVIRRYKEGMEVKRVIQVGFQHPENLTLAKNDPLITQFETRLKNRRDQFERRKMALVTEELARRIEETERPRQNLIELRNRLKELGAAVALPIVVRGELIGIMTLSDKLSGDVFSTTDLDLLETVAHETAGAIEKARLWEEDQLKTEFVSIASHELLTPTSTIQGYLSMILDEGMGTVDPKARGYLETVRVTSKRLTELVQDLLNVSRIESGRIKINPQSMDLLVVIREVITELTPKAHEKGLSLHFEDIARRNGQLKMDNGQKNSQLTVFADPERVRQILVNLVGNGIKYTEKGGVTVSVDREAKLAKVTVTDTGIGMSKEDQAHLFEKFYRIQNEKTKEISGTGLGLYITKNMIELMGGKISVESAPDKGSSFIFTLPLGGK